MPSNEENILLPNSRRRSQSSTDFKSIIPSLAVFIVICVICAPIAYFLSFVLADFLKLDLPTIPRVPAARCGKRLIGYYSFWQENKLHESQLKNLTHLIFMFADVEKSGHAIINKSFGEVRFWDMKKIANNARKDGLKILIAVGGYATSRNFAEIVQFFTDPVKRNAFLDSIISLLDEYDVDGIEVFWMWPKTEDKVALLRFIRELREKMTEHKIRKQREEDYILSVIAPRNISKLENIYYLNDILKHVDFINIITHEWQYDNNVVGPISALYGSPGDNIDDTMKYLTCQTKQPSKLNLAVPMHGFYWVGTTFPLNHTQKLTLQKDTEGPYEMPWKLWKMESWAAFPVQWHNETRTPYVWEISEYSKKRIFVTFENERSLREKANYAKMKNLGGVTMYSIDQDENNTLMNAVASVDLCTDDRRDVINYDCGE